ncbi:MAG: hypothetical protein Terrestrivirus4_101 [Terrestrivirus sp.]|uniref:Uncharacterized protein n=1 Tax=Terrestrivirus sp. TaxID=2487775 RepID=A0A3G4ZR22_9VIRU|nr:MAG: hypothetical protein Terrestrivirus4_101 [Terrestrivirus sp.]
MESHKNNSSPFTQWKDTSEVKYDVFIKDVDEIWNETTIGYIDMVNKLSYISHISKKNNKTEAPQMAETYLPLNVRDKLFFLISDMKDVMITMEKICCTIDDINAKNGSIEISQNDIKKSIVSNSNIY